MSECFVITSYCNSQTKLDALDRTLENLKQYEFPVFIHAHYPLPVEYQKKVHSYFYSSENPILPRWNLFWYFIEQYKLEIKAYDLAYTVLKAWRESIQILENYDRLHILNYDTNIIPEVFQFTRRTDKSIFFQNGDLTKLHTVMVYYCLNKQSYEYFREQLRLENYLSFLPGGKFLPIPEEYLTKIISNNDFYMVPINEYDGQSFVEYDVVSDSRFEWEKSLSIHGIKMFIGDINNSAHILIFDVKSPISFEFVCPSKKICTEIRETTLYDLGVPLKDLWFMIGNINSYPIDTEFVNKFIKMECKIYV